MILYDFIYYVVKPIINHPQGLTFVAVRPSQMWGRSGFLWLCQVDGLQFGGPAARGHGDFTGDFIGYN